MSHFFLDEGNWDSEILETCSRSHSQQVRVKIWTQICLPPKTVFTTPHFEIRIFDWLMFTSHILFHILTLLPQPDIMHLKLFVTVQFTFIEHQLCARHHARMNEDFITSFKELHLARSLLKAFWKLLKSLPDLLCEWQSIIFPLILAGDPREKNATFPCLLSHTAQWAPH